MPPSLGPTFWSNFALLDDEHTEVLLECHLLTLQLQLQTKDAALDVVQQNCIMAMESVRSIGFRVPSAAGKRVICMWCWTSRSCNSSSLQAHLVTCAVCPESIKSRYRKAATEGKSSAYYFGASQLASAQAAQQQVSSPQPSRTIATQPASPATITAASSSADAGSRKRPAAVLKPTTLFSSTVVDASTSTAFDAMPCLVAHEEQSGRRIRVRSAADADAEALANPNCWRQWAAICERQGVHSLS